MEAARQRRDYLTNQLSNRRELFALGYATADRIEEVRVELNRARQDIGDGDAGIAALEAEITRRNWPAPERPRWNSASPGSAQRSAEETGIDQTATVLAPGAGRVTR